MRKTLERSVRFGGLLEMMYIVSNGSISKRRIKVLQVGESSFRAYCYLRKSKRTFTIDNVLALVPVIDRESRVI
ncbi:transcriptional regulator [Sporosarcina saromensis]|uniref:Transcriptional regulator n=1 Tax=Sporosarcina saromensis TaxID=359365 RepID=A0ABU4G9T7_9BACL|nr:transcriptional regulator [Sporosarcina saromensis]MDW0113744.1 transcriptional regulator [Sporosarcina saromensis]